MQPHVSKHGDHQHIQWLGGSHVRILLDGAATGGQFNLIEESFGAGDGSPLHIHYHEDETFWILDGAMTVWIGDERVEASQGDVVFLPRGIPHAFRVTLPESRAMILTTPSGIEDMYREAGWDLSTPLPADWSVSMAQLKSITERRQTPILGPAPTS
jgi:mannose-6-phosphate isomerase-like protein (cupin superfamily)